MVDGKARSGWRWDAAARETARGSPGPGLAFMGSRGEKPRGGNRRAGWGLEMLQRHRERRLEYRYSVSLHLLLGI